MFIQKFRFFLVLILLSSVTVLGQKTESHTFYAIELPEQKIEQVVKRVLAYYFRPSSKSRVIYLAQENIQKSWLPSIKNTEFELLSANEIEQKRINVYLFSDIWQNTPGLYRVVFAYGDPSCKYLGDIWHFRVSELKLSIWRKHNSQIIGGCSHPSFPPIIKQ